MPDEPDILNRIHVAKPCSAPWAEMRGDERVRFCGQCEKRVYNLSELTRFEAQNLILAHEGRLCVRYYQRADGTVLTQDCPVGVRRLRLQARRLVFACLTLFGGAAACLAYVTTGTRLAEFRLRWIQPYQKIADWIDPPLQKSVLIMGERSMPVPITRTPSAPPVNVSDSVQPPSGKTEAP